MKLTGKLALCLASACLLTSTAAWSQAPAPKNGKTYRIAYIARAQGDSFAAWLADAVVKESKKYPDTQVTVFDGQSKNELIASNRTEEEICREIGADALIYQDLDDLKAAVQAINPAISVFETSCFDGCYVTGDVTPEYLSGVENQRNDAASKPGAEDGPGQMDLNLISRSEN